MVDQCPAVLMVLQQAPVYSFVVFAILQTCWFFIFILLEKILETADESFGNLGPGTVQIGTMAISVLYIKRCCDSLELCSGADPTFRKVFFALLIEGWKYSNLQENE